MPERELQRAVIDSQCLSPPPAPPTEGPRRPQDRPVRLFTFGVGYDVNTDLLDELSRDLGGRSSYVTPDERIDG